MLFLLPTFGCVSLSCSFKPSKAAFITASGQSYGVDLPAFESFSVRTGGCGLIRVQHVIIGTFFRISVRHGIHGGH